MKIFNCLNKMLFCLFLIQISYGMEGSSSSTSRVENVSDQMQVMRTNVYNFLVYFKNRASEMIEASEKLYKVPATLELFRTQLYRVNAHLRYDLYTPLNADLWDDRQLANRVNSLNQTEIESLAEILGSSLDRLDEIEEAISFEEKTAAS